MSEPKDQNEAACGGSDLTAELDAQRATVQAQLDEAMAALQRYSRINGVRKSDVARASLGPALLKKRLDDIEAQIAAFNVALRGEPLAASPSRKQGSASAGSEKGS